MIRGAVRYVQAHLAALSSPHVRPSRPLADGARVVVSLTTTPSRINRIAPALASLLHQTRLADQILLAVPTYSRREDRPYVVPAWLASHPAVTILRTDRDWGPATKLLPALQAEAARPDTLVVAVDDDNVYPGELLDTFVRFSRERPEAALCFRGWAVPASRAWKDSREILGTAITSPVATDIITGCGGILVRPSFFDQSVFDYSRAPAHAFFVDDIWTSGHLARRRVPRLIIPSAAPFVYARTLTTLLAAGLDRTENRPGSPHNDAMLASFAEDWGRSADRSPIA